MKSIGPLEFARVERHSALPAPICLFIFFTALFYYCDKKKKKKADTSIGKKIADPQENCRNSKILNYTKDAKEDFFFTRKDKENLSPHTFSPRSVLAKLYIMQSNGSQDN